MGSETKTWAAATEMLWDGLGVAIVIMAVVFGCTQCTRCQIEQDRFDIEKHNLRDAKP